MTCQLRVVAANGQVTKARALLESASLASFITERLAQLLQLPRVRRSLQISDIEGVDTHLTSRGIVCFNVTNLSHETYQLPMEAVVLPNITVDLPVRHIPKDASNRTAFGGSRLHCPGIRRSVVGRGSILDHSAPW